LKKIEEIEWWHQVPLKDGRVTPGLSPVYLMEKEYLFDQINFKDSSVIDIGCWDGYFSFKAEARGAKEVIAFDDPSFRWGGLDGFNFLHHHFNSRAKWVKGTIFNPPKRQFDIVLCYGVLYHLNDPLTAATNCFQMSKDLVCFEGLIFEADLPSLLLIPPGTCNGDMTNIYTMSTGYLKTVAELNGFKLTHHCQYSKHRGSLCFKRDRKASLPYLKHAFSLPPVD
jgi:tRNA (mo5U34)-methyltransferase